ncbi:MAG: adenosylcobinamide-phosphate synthase CbiB [Proteobacteria bacterium]|nr:adenosylcobinamide-phosphate synthase CbiB [Pseudomonadota bacterium]MBU1612164.1 adenosylcobinamide-phosphate synthase CbiB [Pseudomonadota bacterium]
MTDLAAYTWTIPGLAVLFDLLLGDPRWLPHPVRLIGNLADGFELLAQSAWSGLPGRLAGFFAAMALVVLVAVTVYALTSIGPAGFFVTLYLCYAGLALRCLLSEAGHVHRLLESGQLTEAKVALSMLVTRDTGSMTADEVRRSLAETVSENLNDGFVAPFFWLCLGGPVVMWIYKTISTLDSMWGYKTEKYADFGWFAAKTDDILAWIPARITALTMLVTGLIMKLDVRQAFKYSLKDAVKMESPNAGYPMAFSAWLVGAQMGGPTMYFGEIKNKPVLGPQGEVWSAEKYSKLAWLVLMTGLLLACIGQMLLFFI